MSRRDLYVWVILWAAAAVVPEREHVVFDLLWNSVGRRTRQVMRIVGNLLIGGLAAWSRCPASWDYVHFMAREGTPVLNIRSCGCSALRCFADGSPGGAQRVGHLAMPCAVSGLDAEAALTA
jgi:TRAP-type C4-dicarboxylate transport system permease small subunit